jgi:hypothetical protein
VGRTAYLWGAFSQSPSKARGEVHADRDQGEQDGDRDKQPRRRPAILDGGDRSVSYALALLGGNASQRLDFRVGQVAPDPHHTQIRSLNRPAITISEQHLRGSDALTGLLQCRKQRLYRLRRVLAREFVDILDDRRPSAWIAGKSFRLAHNLRPQSA